MHIAKKLVWVGFGILSLVFAVIAYIVPLIPTVPFVLLAAWCFANGSQRMHNWLMHRTFLGKMVLDYQNKHAIPRWVKYFSIICMWGSTIFTSIFVLPNLYIWIIMPIVSAIGTWFVARIPALEEIEKLEN